MSVRNWEREGKLGQRLAELGCREVEITTYVDADREGIRKLDLDVMNSAWAGIRTDGRQVCTPMDRRHDCG